MGDQTMSGPGAYVFDAYGTLFDVHAAIARHRAAAGPDADRFSEIWRLKQLEYAWTFTLAGHYSDFWTLTERALAIDTYLSYQQDRTINGPMTRSNSSPIVPLIRVPARHASARLLYQLRPPAAALRATPNTALTVPAASKCGGTRPQTPTPRLRQRSRVIEIP